VVRGPQFEKRCPKQYNVAAILSLLFIVPILLAAALANVLLHQHFPKYVYYYYYYYYYYYVNSQAG
jgi:hypothetical protein